MKRFSQPIVLASLAAAAFAAAFASRRSLHDQTEPAARASVDLHAPDSVKLAAMGFAPGRQLVAYIIVSSRCGYCQQPDTKAALASVRRLLHERGDSAFRSISVVGVVLNVDLREGLEYAASVGLPNFDEISVGNSWHNEHLVQLIWRSQSAPHVVPLVVVFSRSMTSGLSPLRVTYGADSLVMVVRGQRAIVDWVKGGAILSRSNNERSGVSRSPASDETALSSSPAKARR